MVVPGLLAPRRTGSAVFLPYRIIGYTAEECERDMRRMTNGERGCANPEEHEARTGRTRTATGGSHPTVQRRRFD